MASAQAGDRDALEELLRQHYDRWYALCRRITGDDADAADATQEAMMAVVRGLRSFDGRSRFSTWSYRIAVNAALDEIRRRRRRPAPESEVVDRVMRASPDPAVSSDWRLDIDAALARLPLEFRTAVVLRDLCGLDYAEIASTLGIPVGTVRSRIARGRRLLVPLLEGNAAPLSERPTERT